MLVLGPKDVQEGGAAVREGGKLVQVQGEDDASLSLSFFSAMELEGAGASPNAGWGALQVG